MIKPGIWRHSKSGHDVRVMFVAKHSEILDDLVVYEHIGPNELSKYWVRPVSMWQEIVEVKGKKVPRFLYLGDK